MLLDQQPANSLYNNFTSFAFCYPFYCYLTELHKESVYRLENSGSCQLYAVSGSEQLLVRVGSTENAGFFMINGVRISLHTPEHANVIETKLGCEEKTKRLLFQIFDWSNEHFGQRCPTI